VEFFGERQLPFVAEDRGRDIVDKIKALQAAADKPVFDQLYNILTILDNKARGLLTVDALFIAILGFLSRSISSSTGTEAPPRSLIYFQLALAVFSAFLCMLVVRVSWKFLGKAEKTQSSPPAFNFGNELNALANVVDDRTHYYWIAWVAALFAFVLTLAWWSPGATFAVVLVAALVIYFQVARGDEGAGREEEVNSEQDRDP
jgi:membrane protein implicated in regulation of membrane protease activity